MLCWKFESSSQHMYYIHTSFSVLLM
jgi:hypothetical protein